MYLQVIEYADLVHPWKQKVKSTSCLILRPTQTPLKSRWLPPRGKKIVKNWSNIVYWIKIAKKHCILIKRTLITLCKYYIKIPWHLIHENFARERDK